MQLRDPILDLLKTCSTKKIQTTLCFLNLYLHVKNQVVSSILTWDIVDTGTGTGKTNALLNLINDQQDIDKIYLYAKDPYEDKYQYLINKRERVGINHLNDPKAFIEYSNDMHNVYKILITITPIKKIRY